MSRLDAITAAVLDGLKPPTRMTISEWAEANLVLSPEDSAERGRYRGDRAPYQRGILDAICDTSIEAVVVMSSAQVGKSLCAKAAVGYYIDQDPSPILLVMPTLETAQSFSRDRLAPMFRDTECLRDKVSSPKARDSGNTTLRKTFPGGHLTIVGANSAAGLASRPIRILICDEVDRYPPSAGTEGDPVNLGIARTKTFWNRRVLLMSTPGDCDTSRIEPAFRASDQRRFYVRCADCDQPQTLKWASVVWTNDEPATARYGCEHCGTLWGDAERIESLQSGEWIAEFPERKVAGFHLNELYSPFRKLREMVTDFLAAKTKPETLRTWINTSLGETWKAEDEGEKLEAHELADRCEPYTVPPHGVLLVTLQIDVQDDRLEKFIGSRVTKKGLSVQPLKTGQRAVLRAGFASKRGDAYFGRAAKSGKQYGSPHVGRTPIVRLFGPNVLSQFIKDTVQQAGADTWATRLPIELERETAFALTQAGLI